MQLSRLLCLLIVPLPQPLKRAAYRLIGWKIGRNVRIGLSYLEGGQVVLGDGVTIGHFNIVRGVKRLAIGAGTYIANFNHFYGTGYGEGRAGCLEIGANVNLMSHHFIDVAGTVTIGDRAIIGGRDTQFWSHQMSFADGASRLVPVRVCVGEDAYVGARTMLLGCSIPAGAVVGAGSVVTKDFEPEAQRLLIAGNPATIRKRYGGKGAATGMPSSS